MNTVYNLLNPNEPVSKGMIEVFNMYDYRIYLIALDGKSIDTVDSSDYEDYILDTKFLKKCLKQSGVAAKDLMFALYDFQVFANQATNNMYDVNNYGYKDIYNLVNNHIQHEDLLNKKIIAHGVEF
jgi:hypothetical protein